MSRSHLARSNLRSAQRATPVLLLLAFSVAGASAADAPATAAANAAAAASAPVELPPMMVEESVSSVPWRYAKVEGTEFLSRCSVATTRSFVEAWLTRMQHLRVLVPEEFLTRTDVPSVIVLYAQDLQQTVSAEIQRELQSADSSQAARPNENRVNIAPNMRLTDRDMHASIVYIDETLFDSATLSLAPSHVRYLLKGRVPELPAWLVDGIERMWRVTDFVLEPITLRPLIWQNQSESDALTNDPARPRALLPANELFATDAARAHESSHPRHVETRACTQELFVRWAILAGRATRDALWKLAGRAAEEPVTEEMFEEIFGFDFCELRDRLSDYLPKAAGQTKWLAPGPLPPQPSFEVERATPNQIARVRGEWERLAIGYVQRRMPQAREPYLAQARRTLRRAYDAGDRDPRLLATMGLVEIDAGDEAAARHYLELATGTGVVRPRAYFELGRLRLAELQHAAPETKLFSFTELAPIIQPLERAVMQAPPMPEVFALLAEAWARCETAPNSAELAELETGSRLFARHPHVALPIAHALARHGKAPAAAAVLAACAGYPTDNDTQAQIARLRAELAGSASGSTAAQP